MDSFNATDYFEHLKSKVIDDRNLLDTIKKLEKAWEKADKVEVKQLSESLCRNIQTLVITDGQRNVLVDMTNGKVKPKKKKKKKTTQKLQGEASVVARVPKDHLEKETEHTVDVERTGAHLEASGVASPSQVQLDEQTEPTVNVERTDEHMEAIDAASFPQDQLEEHTEPTVNVERTDKHIIAELKATVKNQEVILQRYQSGLIDANNKNDHLSESLSSLQDQIMNHSKREKALEEETKVLTCETETLKAEKDQALAKLSNIKSEKSVREKEMEEEIKVFEHEIETFKSDMTQSEREKELEEEIKVLKRETKTLKADRRQSKKEKELKDENKVLAREIETLKHDKEKALSKSKPKLKDVNKQQLEKENIEMKRKIKEITEENEQLKAERQFQQSSIKNLQERLRVNDISLQRSKTSLEESNKKNNQLVTRLSKVAGTKLMHNNPNIADLSDKDRPTKLAEKYSELYDNEYTDAFTAFNEAQNIADKEIITFLLEILLDCFAVCMEKSNEQMVYIKSILLFPSKVELKSPEEIPFTEEQEKMVTDLRKQTAEITHKDLFQDIKTRHKTASMPQEVIKFIGCCTELCWKMVVQTPPLYLDVTDSKHDVFNKDVYKPYTKIGKRIRFVVWPPLYLHEHGPILCKGTAQGGD